jgi:hypothetical protein
MKALRNTWVTGGLCAIAAVVVVYQLFQPSLHRHWSSGTKKAASPAAPASNPVAPSRPPPALAALPPAARIETQYAQARMAEWINAPRRDPFLLLNPGPGKKASEKSSAVTRLKLQGIWRQTGGRFAAINNRIYGEGDVIEGYRIERIDADQVWFAGPGRKERLLFDKYEVKALVPESTNTLSAASGRKARSAGPRL